MERISAREFCPVVVKCAPRVLTKVAIKIDDRAAAAAGVG